MEVKEAIFGRRSVRFFNDKPIEEGVLREILLAGIYAPTAGNLQPWAFFCYHDRHKVESIKSVAPGILGNPSAVIVACLDKGKLNKNDSQQWFLNGVMDVAMACQNMMLRAFELGIGSCPVTSFDSDSLVRILALPLEYHPLILVILGFFDKLPVVPKRDVSVIHIEVKTDEEKQPFELELLGFLLSSLKLSISEPSNYTRIRLMEAAIRTCEYLRNAFPHVRNLLEEIEVTLKSAATSCFYDNSVYKELFEKSLVLYTNLMSRLRKNPNFGSKNQGGD